MSFARTRSAGRSALLLLAVLGCKAETFGGPAEPLSTAKVVVEPADAWPGQEVTLRSPAFAKIAEEAALLGIEEGSAAAVRLDDSTFRALLPTDLRAGAHRFVLRFRSDSAVGSLTTVGDDGLTVSSAYFAVLNPQPWPWQAPTGVLGVGSDQTVQYVDAASGRATQFRGLKGHYSYAPGISYRRNIAVGVGPTGTAALATLDLFTGTFTQETTQTSNWRQVFEISAGRYIVTTNHNTYVQGDSGTAVYATESPWYFVISPDGQWGTIIANTSMLSATSQYQLPIIDLPTGRVARDLVGIGSTDAIAWALDSKSVYIAARPCWSCGQRLVRMDALTGDTIASIATESDWWDSSATWGLAIDPRRGLLYDVAKDGDQWIFRVRDLESLAIVGSARTRPTKTCSYHAGFPVIIADRSSPLVHIVENSCGQVVIHHFKVRD